MSQSNVADDDRRWMTLAIELSKRCPVSPNAYSVGAIVVDVDGNEIARGWSREMDEHVHAEESALSKIPEGDPRLAGATIYSTLEPCSQRKSRPVPCAQLIVARNVPRIVIAWREPALFVADCQGVEVLQRAQREVVELGQLAGPAREVNAHLFKSEPGTDF